MAYSPKDYVLPDGLLHALEGAMALGQPLLLTGEPGTGKTTLADWAAWHLGQQPPPGQAAFAPEVLRFQTKTSSIAQDLFYTYDALAHFQAANLGGSAQGAAAFIELQALGKAIAMSDPRPAFSGLFRTDLPTAPQSSVVLVDEVDKAPRDFTNDILDEIDRKRFFLREHNLTIEKGDQAQIMVIMTSNSEKNLPDPFLRRCAFFHIEFPRGERLRSIVGHHLGQDTPFAGEALDKLLAFFEAVRQASVRKKPATAELIGWLRILGLHDYLNKPSPAQQQLMRDNLAFLVKTREDLEAVRKLLT
jgi:MoxR-like ATPase